MATNNDIQKLSTDVQKLIDWVNDMKKTGIYAKGTAEGRISAINKIFSILGKAESRELKSLSKNSDELINRWAKKTNAPPTSIQPAKSHARGFFRDYFKYQEDPSSLKPITRKIKAKKEKPKKPSVSTKKTDLLQCP